MTSEAEVKPESGPAYKVADATLKAMKALSLVEGLKWVASRVMRGSPPLTARRVDHWVVDAFICLKWLVVVGAWVFGWTDALLVAFVVYLLVMNLHTYFWHHLWKIEEAPAMPPAGHRVDDLQRERRRFLNLASAVAFSMVTYAFLYDRVLTKQFSFPTGMRVAPWVAALKFSIGNALTGSTGDLTPVTSTAYLVTTSQLAMTFVFAAMLLSNSLPKRSRGGA